MSDNINKEIKLGDNDILEIKKPTEYSIKKIILADGTELDIEKGISGLIILKTHEEEGMAYFKASYYTTSKEDMKLLSNEAVMASYALKHLAANGLPFEKGCEQFKKMLFKFRDEI